MIGQVKWPPYQAIDKVQPANSVNAKTYGHANTELNSTKVDKCVESINGQPQVGYDVFRTYMKMYEPTGNKLVTQKCGVTDCVMLMMVDKRQPPYLVTGMEHFPNSVNPKSFRYGNTEPSMNYKKFKACVENVQEASKLDEDSFRACRKLQELDRNALTDTQKYRNKNCGVICMISFQVAMPFYSVMNRMHPANSVNPKSFRYGNTELNSEKFDKRVESIYWASQREDDVLRTTGKLVECHRNDGITYLKICGNRLRAWYSDFAVPKYDRLVVMCRPETVAMPLKKRANSVNAKAKCYANAELNSEKSDKCVENKCSLTQVVKDMFRPAWKRAEPTGNKLVICS